MRIVLFIPCYIDAFFPGSRHCHARLLERFGRDVVYPRPDRLRAADGQ
jgi:L-lactate dehydrogenase complex protein LldE